MLRQFELPIQFRSWGPMPAISRTPALRTAGSSAEARDMGRRGFSLSEMSVVLALIGIGISIAVPSFSAMRARGRLREAAREVSHALAEARSVARSRRAGLPGWAAEAVVRSTYVTVEDGRRIEVYADADELSGNGGEVLVMSVDVGDRLQLALDPGDLRFRRNGTLNETKDRRLTLGDADYGLQYTIRVAYGGSVELVAGAP